MKKTKIVLIVIFLIFAVLFIFSNWAFFSHKEALGIKLFKFGYYLPELATGLLLIGCFLAGCLIIYILNLMNQFKSSQEIKTLKANIKNLEAETSKLKATTPSMSEPYPDPQPEQPEPQPESEQNTPEETLAEEPADKTEDADSTDTDKG